LQRSATQTAADALDAARKREAATREILEVISHSRDDDRPVFDAILHSAARLCGADSAGLLLGRPGGAHLTLAALQEPMGISASERDAFITDINRVPMQMDPALHVSAQAICFGKVVHLADVAQTAGYLSGERTFRSMVDEQGIRTILSVPLFDAMGTLGAINLHRCEVRLFSEDEIALVQSFAAQAVIAIENVRQFRELQTRLAREAATREILEVISRSRDDDRPVFEVIVRSAARLCNAQMAWLLLTAPASRAFVLAGYHGLSLRQIELGDVFEIQAEPDSITGVGRAIYGAQTVPEEDLAQTAHYLNDIGDMRMLVDVEGIRSRLCVPLISGGAGIGAIVLTRREVAPFTADQIALVETFAAQAIIAIENVRQFRELQDSLEQQEATSDILRVISQSREDETQVFDLILEKAAVLCDADQGSLQIVNVARTHVRLMADWGHNRTAWQPGSEFSLDLPLSIVATIRTAKVVHIEDYSQSDAYKDRDPIAVGLVETEGHRTRLIVPLLQNGIAIGCISLSRRTVRPFTPDEIALVETFAAQAVIAIENVRQFRELQTRLEREKASAAILEVISQSREDERPVFDVILRNAARLCNAPIACLMLVNAAGTHIVMAAMYGETLRTHLTGDSWPMDPPTGPVARSVRAARIEHMHDLALTDEYRSGHPTYVRLVDEDGLRTELSVPLVRDGVGFGAITLSRREANPFAVGEIALVETFAAQAVIAIENVRQFRELQTRLAREAATREILEVISQSRDDEGPVFDVIAQRAAGLCGAAVCTFWRVKDGSIHYCASHGLDSASFAETRSTPSIPLLDSTLTGQVVKTRAVVRIEDATAESYLDHKWARRQGLRQLIGVPILIGDEVWGSINLMWPADRAPGDADIQLVESFADQASIAIENTRQFRELQTRLAREAATREILEVISRNPDDDRPVFDAILGNAIRLCGADSSSLILGRRDDPRMKLAAWRDKASSSTVHDDAMIATFNATDLLMDPAVHISAQVICEERKMQVLDVLQSEGYLSGEPSYLIMADTLRVRTALLIPLIDARGALGVVHVHRREVRPFSDDEIALVETFAAQAVIAIENVRQYRELQDRLAREEATRQILQVISQSRDDETPVFDAILERAERLCDAPSSALLLVNDARSHLVLVATRGMRSSADIGETHPITSGHTSSDAVLTGTIAHVPDVRDTELYRNGDPLRVELVEQWGLRTSLAVPLISNGKAIGALTVMRLHNERPFSDNDIRLLEAFAAQAVIAIENVRQFKALEALNAELGDRVQVQVGEIERMGRLKRFLPAAVADAVVTSGSEKLLSSHRVLLGVLFCDIRGFTAFCETAEPEETIEVLQTYHEEMGKLINAHGAGVDHRMGDGIMVLFNDPLPCDDPAGDAVRLAMAMRARMAELCQQWKRLGHRLGFGMGVSLGYATVGMVGFEGRHDYTASGTAINLASRLCDEAQDGEILISPRTRAAVEGDFTVSSRGEITFKGIREPVEVFCVTGAVG
jgi:GAF domain-containing protein